MVTPSKTQIDRLGDRLRKGPPRESDFKFLDEYRRSFGPAYESVIRTIREKLKLEPTGRPAKSTTSIIEKLRRESIRLSQVQDIAGCRVVLPDVITQNRTIEALHDEFPQARVTDRRTNPSHGYRAVHVIVETEHTSVEIQVRSSLQHLWAELSERLSDVVDFTIKYGGGDHVLRNALTTLCQVIAEFEESEQMDTIPGTQVSDLQLKKRITQTLSDLITELENQKSKQR